MSQNQLADETSPYLLQHKDNPVHWRPWGPEAFAEAKRQNKPILLSVGYAACHWCHVMAHESFENPATAEAMNRLFVNIKVDREERPDVDLIYQSALALLGEHGGWPLTMFLTPDGEPFWGGTYFPSSARYGRPAFADVLHRIAEIHSDEPDKVLHNAQALRDGIARLGESAGNGALSRAGLDATADAALQLVDPANGGTHGAPKFPQPTFFRFLWRAYRRTGKDAYRGAVTTTLDAMSQGGIYDHLGGGYARYSTDAVWLVPHFEKMLYDNAQILELLAETWRVTGSDLYAVRAAETVDWTLRDMKVEAPGNPDSFAFASAFDADSEGVEGLYYVWSDEEIDSVLGPEDSAFFKTAYGVTAPGNWETVNILNRSAAPGLRTPEEEDRLAAARTKLLAARNGRIPPLRDDKVLADWNGLMIAALANAGMTFERPDWIAAARTVFDFILDQHGKDGRLRHSWRGGRGRHPAVLDDYANLARAALALYQATDDPDYLARTESWANLLDDHYWDDAAGAYFLTAADTADLITRPKTAADNAVPPGNGTMAEVLARLFHLTGNPHYRNRAEGLISALAAPEPERNLAMTTLCMGFEILDNPVQTVIVGKKGKPDTESLLLTARRFGPPSQVICRADPGGRLPDDHPAHGKPQVEGKATAYVCVGATCGLPTADPEVLRESLSQL